MKILRALIICCVVLMVVYAVWYTATSDMQRKSLLTIGDGEAFEAYHVMVTEWGKCVRWRRTPDSELSTYCGHFTVETYR